MKKRVNLLIDLSNAVYSTHHTLLKKNSGDFNPDFLFYKTINLIKYTALKYKVDGILIACDSPNVWRKKVFPEYKAHRDELRDIYHKDVKKVMIDVANFFNECTSIPALSVPKAEADDIIAVLCKESPNKHVIMSSDKDFIQLIDEDTRLYAHTLQKERDSEDVGFDLFMKCIRGDRGDNILSAYPRVREKALRKAWEDSGEMLNLMETVRKDGVKVADAYKENKLLIDLDMQPQEVKDEILTRINNLIPNKYNHIKMLRYIGDHNLKTVSKDIINNRDIFKKTYIFN